MFDEAPSPDHLSWQQTSRLTVEYGEESRRQRAAENIMMRRRNSEMLPMCDLETANELSDDARSSSKASCRVDRDSVIILEG